MEWLKQILEGAKIEDGKLDITAIMETVNKEFPKYAVPKETFNNTNKELKTANETIKTLKENNASNEELQKTIKQHEDDTKALKAAHAKEINDMKIDNAIKDILIKNKAIHVDLLKTQFNRENIKLNEDGTITGLEEQFNSIKETYKDQFKLDNEGEENKGSNYRYVPSSGNNSGGKATSSFLDVIKENQVRK